MVGEQGLGGNGAEQGDDPADEHRDERVEQRDGQPGAEQGDVVPAHLPLRKNP